MIPASLFIHSHAYFLSTYLLSIDTINETKIQKLMDSLDGESKKKSEQFQRVHNFIKRELIMGEVDSITDGSCSFRIYSVWQLMWASFDAAYGLLRLSNDEIEKLLPVIWDWSGFKWEE